MSAPLPLHFFLIGAQKCATSWLYLCLREHPELQLSLRKDEANYLGSPRHREHGDDWFRALYADVADGGRRGSVSVDYLYDAAALEQALQLYPQARFVVCLRDPLQRSASAFHFLSRKGLLPQREFNDGIAAALRAFAQPEPETRAEAELIERGLYARQLQPFARLRAWDRLLVVGYEWLSLHPQQALEQIYAFVGAAPHFLPPSFAQRPKINANWALLNRIERLLPGSRLLGKLMDHANRWIVNLGLARPRPLYRPELERQLRALFGPDVAALERLLADVPARQRLFRAGPLTDWGFLPTAPPAGND